MMTEATMKTPIMAAKTMIAMKRGIPPSCIFAISFYECLHDHCQNDGYDQGIDRNGLGEGDG